ncbi:MAG TPA: uroporphyrinogen decarboxylase [Candidatus Bathyarchaeia archaeon]|nr:uroporphyrinogen decarboxylase [Candidatus Bathyarchaeia archaeon]
MENDNFLRACWRKEAEYTPAWFMRQAGRYLESYRKVRTEHDILTICKTPELAAKVAVEAAEQLGVDAAILFADIMLPLEGMGVGFKIVEGVGPQIDNPIRSMEDVENIGQLDPRKHVPFVLDAIGLIKNQIGDRIPLIGFSGAPFTLASYIIEGGPSRDFIESKKMMYGQPAVWARLLTKLSEMVAEYLQAQIRAGVDAVQLFDSWSGCLSPSDYEEFVLPYSRTIFDKLEGKGVPRIHFGVGTAGILKMMRRAGGDVFGVDWRIPIDEAWTLLGDAAIQGNLDPATLLGNPGLIESRAKEILVRIGGRPGHVFNLGHGVLPQTQPENLRNLVRFVHDSTTRKR